MPAGVTVREAVELGRSPHIKPLQRPTRHDREAVERALERTGVVEFADRRLTTLSGGELQRVQIAVGLAQEAPVADRRRADLAPRPRRHRDVARLLRGLADDGLSVILVVHDLALAAAVADTVVVMAGGRTAATGAPREVLTLSGCATSGASTPARRARRAARQLARAVNRAAPQPPRSGPGARGLPAFARGPRLV